LTLAARVVIASLILLLLWMKWLTAYPNYQWTGVENALRSSALGQACLRFGEGISGVYLVPAVLMGLYVCSWRGYTGTKIEFHFYLRRGC
jgi:hypothetical protein